MKSKLKHIEDPKRDCPHCVDWIRSDPRKEKFYTTGKEGLVFQTTDLNLFYRIKKFLGIK